MSEQSKSQYIHGYIKEHYVRTEIMWPKEKNLKQRIKAAAERDGISSTQWIIKAIEKELEWYE